MNEQPESNHPGQPPADATYEVRPITLCPEDAAALDCLLDQAPAADPHRHARVQAWLGLLDKAPVTPPSTDLVARTLAAIHKHHTPPVAPPKPLATTPVRTLPFGSYLTEWVAMAVAASLVIAVLIPGISSARQDAQRVSCSANLASLGQGIATYAANNHNELPSLGKTPDGDWLPHENLQVASGHSNTANLLPLIRQGYVSKQRLVCPGRGVVNASFDPLKNEIPDNIRGYSYINLFGETKKWDQQDSSIILADRNPLFDVDNPHDPMANSLNHGRHGTNVLAASQSVHTVTNPNVGPHGSNIWTIDNGKTVEYKGHELPTDPQIDFLAP